MGVDCVPRDCCSGCVAECGLFGRRPGGFLPPPGLVDEMVVTAEQARLEAPQLDDVLRDVPPDVEIVRPSDARFPDLVPQFAVSEVD